jgi:prepilin-type N-terminal cleavage/methylation domain-containing protein
MFVERRQSYPQAGFSLIEMLVVVVILLILFTIYWGSSSGGHQQKLQANCRNNLQKLYLALEIYASDHSARFPAVTGARTAEEPLDLLVPRYTVDTSLFRCPGSDEAALPSGESLLKHKISYAYYMGCSNTNGAQVLMSDRQIDGLPKTAGQLLFSSTGQPPGNNHNKFGGNLLFSDGHTELSGARAPFPIPLATGVVLLNPK